MFQSSPTSKGGRYGALDPDESGEKCFNPRPPLKVGATAGPVVMEVGECVSILAHL